jgi:hypothetical protein
VFLLGAWDYPGTRLDALITDVLRTLAEAEQGDIAVEGRDVFYAVYDARTPSGVDHVVVYLVNHDVYAQPAYPTLIERGNRWPVRVDGREMRVAWVFDRLLVSPHDKYVKVVDARREGATWEITLESAPVAPGGSPAAARDLQLEAADELDLVELDGRELQVTPGRDGDTAVRGPVQLRSVLRVRARR